ncbi:MAG TPA: type II secretion system F family protein [Anaerolineae bacterium]|nr:type II secretion system F family protein [Anaerolineae bacterium]HOR01201.1 type II secretion system F family protein [Anaerolineae bacterium]HPL29345.1 type II secretion system F family protein [Anaerolineae bacterium]
MDGFSPVLIAAVVAEFLAIAVGLLWVGLEVKRQERHSTERIEQVIATQLVAPTLELQASFVQRILQPILRQFLGRIGRLSPKGNLDKLRQQLVIAGSPLGLGALDFVGLRVLVAVLGTAGVLLALASRSGPMLQSALFAVGGAMLCSELPNYWLRGRMKKRQKEVLLALPDALDMLTVCVDAGLGLESAFLRIGQGWDHALAQEFRRVVAATGYGVSWREALRDMVYRTDVPDLSALVAVLLQADQLGFSISDTLHSQADQLRVRRRQRAQEVARSAPLKMLFPMVFFIMPAIFAVVIGPAIPAIMSAFQ